MNFIIFVMTLNTRLFLREQSKRNESVTLIGTPAAVWEFAFYKPVFFFFVFFLRSI